MLKAVVFAALSLLATYLYCTLRYKRFKQHASLPRLPPSLLWGHLKAFDDFTRRGKRDRHPDYVFGEMSAALGRPPIMLADLRPVGYPIVLVTNHEVAEQISRATKNLPTSTPKAPTMNNLVHLVGPHTILIKPDEEWKKLRKRFNPGFAPHHLMTLLPCIIDKSVAFLERLDNLALIGKEFSLARITTNLTFDIIGGVVMDLDLHAQGELSQQGELIRLYSELLKTYKDDKTDFPWWIAPRTELRRRHLAKRIEQVLNETIRQKFAERKLQGHTARLDKSVLSISFQDVDNLTTDILDETRDQLKTFLFAGHDTTSILLCWIFYELFRTPQVLHALRTELDSLFGAEDPSPSAVREKLLSPDGEDLVRRMVYVSAVIKEALRLYPPAGTARMAKPGSGLVVTAPSGKQQYCLDGLVIYNCASIIQRDPAVYGDTADDFVPERWLGETGSNVPPSAWRPFERGPRNCIGQELANIEAKVIVALVARRYEFVKVGLGEVSLDKMGQPTILEGKNRYKVKSELYTTREVTAKPVDGMMMKVKMVES